MVNFNVVKNEYIWNGKLKKINPLAINICFLANNNWVKYLSVTLIQINKNISSPVEIFLLSDNISEKNSKKIANLCTRLNFSLNIIDIANSNLNSADYEKDKYWFSNINSKLLILTDFFKDVGTILYLDIDISIVGKLDELFNLKNPISAVVEIASITKKALEWNVPEKLISKFIKENITGKITLEKYFNFLNVENYINAGFLLINPKLCSLQLKISDAFKYIYNEQDYLNLNFSKNMNIIDYKWNLSASFLYPENNLLNITNFNNELDYNNFCLSIDDARIVHYAGYTRPWEIIKKSDKNWDIEWWNSCCESPFKFKIYLRRSLLMVKHVLIKIKEKIWK